MAIMQDGVYKSTGLNNADQIGRAGFNRLMAILAGAVAREGHRLPVSVDHPRQRGRFYNPEVVF